MKASLFYRIAAVLLQLFAVGHALGFRQSDPYLFMLPIVLSSSITVSLTAAAWPSATRN